MLTHARSLALLSGAAVFSLVSSAAAAALRDDPSPVVVKGEVAERLDRYLSRIERMGFSGAVLVADGGEVLLAKGYGLANRGSETPMTPDTIVPLGSISKHFTAAAILKLEMQSKLSTDDPITRFFEGVPQDKAGITVHQLLCHMSGLAEAGAFGAGTSERDAWVQRALQSELAFPPGADFGYSNVGYGVLAAIIEVASGLRYEEYLREEVLLPAGMQDTGAELPGWDMSELAHGYIDDVDTGALLGGGGLGWGLAGAGGLQTNVYDMLRWNVALDEGTVLSGEAVKKMTTPHARMGWGGYGYGCGISQSAQGHTIIGHNGSNDVFSADFRRYPEAGILVYAHGNDADMYAFDVTPKLQAMMFGEDVPEPPEIVELGALDAYAGTWRLESGAEVVVETNGRVLQVSSGDPVAGGLVFHVHPGQLARRQELLGAVGEAFEGAFAGEFDAAHQLLSPYSPPEAFAQRFGQMIADIRGNIGELEAVRTVPGRSRFGEIAVVVVLEGASDRTMIEYSFGDVEVGSIRFVSEFPKRIVRPTSEDSFVSYDVGSGESWTLGFELTEGAPSALLLTDENGAEYRAQRP